MEGNQYLKIPKNHFALYYKSFFLFKNNTPIPQYTFFFYIFDTLICSVFLGEFIDAKNLIMA